MERRITGILFLFAVLTMSAMVAGAQSEVKKDWSPEWAKKVVWYQIFPERFRNGNRDNDPRVENIKGAWPHDYTSPWEIHPWTSDWYELQPWEKKNGKDLMYNIQRRRYGGDLQGIIYKLDYLKKLGVGALYLNPVFESPSLHKYDAVIYHHIDANLGPDPDGDRRLMAGEVPENPMTWGWTSADRLMLDLIREAHSKGIRVIFDGVFNHMGISSPFFQDVLRNQQASRYKDWFAVKSWDDPAKGTKFDYEGWFGFRELPEWREVDGNIVEGPKKYIFEITRRWMDPDGDGDPSDGIDGWRLDVAFCVGHPFWKDWCRHARNLNPEVYTTAEVIDTIEANRPFLQGDEFSAVMNYNFAFTCSEYFIDEKKRITTAEFDRRLRALREAYDPCVSYVMQNLLGSHDTDRVASRIVNRDLVPMRNWPEYCEKARFSNPAYQVRKPRAHEYAVQKLLALFQMTYVGAPMIYYGDEAGMWGASDPCCRKPMVWGDMRYADEVFLPDGGRRPVPDPVSFNDEMYEHYRELIRLRTRYEALQLGDFRTLLTDDRAQLYAFCREHKDQRIIVVINNGSVPAGCTLPAEPGRWYMDVLNEGKRFLADDRGALSVTTEPLWGRILVRRRAAAPHH